MRVFVTGASGFIGSAVVDELIRHGHHVLGLARSDESAKKLIAAGAEVHRGTLEDVDSLRSGVAATDATMHLGFIHDFSKFKENCETDRRAIRAMGEVLAGTDRPLIITSGTGLLTPATRHQHFCCTPTAVCSWRWRPWFCTCAHQYGSRKGRIGLSRRRC